MTTNELRDSIVATLTEIAPEVDPADLAPDEPLRDAVDLDSMDWLNFLVRLHERHGVDFPEADYGRLRTLDDLVRYVEERLPDRTQRA